MQCNAMHCNAIQCNTIQYNAIQCNNAMQCNTVNNIITNTKATINAFQCTATNTTLLQYQPLPKRTAYIQLDKSYGNLLATVKKISVYASDGFFVRAEDEDNWVMAQLTGFALGCIMEQPVGAEPT
eukprot:Awhi_evm1s8851